MPLSRRHILDGNLHSVFDLAVSTGVIWLAVSHQDAKVAELTSHILAFQLLAIVTCISDLCLDLSLPLRPKDLLKFLRVSVQV